MTMPCIFVIPFFLCILRIKIKRVRVFVFVYSLLGRKGDGMEWGGVNWWGGLVDRGKWVV